MLSEPPDASIGFPPKVNSLVDPIANEFHASCSACRRRNFPRSESVTLSSLPYIQVTVQSQKDSWEDGIFTYINA